MIPAQVIGGPVSDRCQYARPFPDDFSGCPTYQAVSFRALDSQGGKLGSWLTCRHLASGDHPEQRGRFYPRCSLGTAESRIRWLARVTEARAEVVRVLQVEFDHVSRAYRDDLLEAKTRLLASPTTPGVRESLHRQLAAYREAIRAFLSDRKVRLDEIGLPMEPLLAMVDAACREWAASQTLAFPDPERSGLGTLPAPFQAFLAHPEATPWAETADQDRTVYQDLILRITESPSRDLRVLGTVDASNVQAVSAVLKSTGQRGQEDRVVDLSGLVFCDVGGLRLIVEAAEQLSGGAKLALEGVPVQLERISRLAGWADHPNLLMTHAAADPA